jgi:multiple sugar transport system permease protein
MARLKRRAKRFVVYGMVALFCFFSASPFLWMIITTFKADRDLYRSMNNPFLFNEPPTLDHLNLLFSETNYTTFLRNSLFVGVAVVIITLIIAIPAAYSLARLTGRWGERAGIAMFLVYLVPPTLLFIPLFRVVVSLGLNNSLWSLVVVYPTISIPFSTWLLMGFFKSIPRDLEEAAMVDGYNRLMAFLRVVMPLSRSGVIAVVVFTFTLTLHEFIYALTFISSSAQRTISVGVPVELIRGDVFFWQSLMAAAVIVAIPVAVVYSMFMDRFIAGFTMGAVKG